MTNQVFHLSLDPPSPHVFYQGATPTAPTSAGAISGPVPAEYAYTLEDSSSAPTPKVSPSKLGHRRAASKGLSLHIPPNDFNKLQPRQPEHANGGHQGQLQPQASASNPSTPWPQMLVSSDEAVYPRPFARPAFLTRLFTSLAHAREPPTGTQYARLANAEEPAASRVGSRHSRLEQGLART